jgi:magnesium-transporting ATPase (P-type)
MNHTLQSFSNSGALLNFPCQFQVKTGNTFNLIYQLIKETRRLAKNMKQSFECYMVFNLIIFWIQLFGILGFLPPIMDGIQSCKFITFPNPQVWIMVVINPILSISLIFNPIEPNIMQLISEKNQHQNWKATKRLIFIILKSIIPSVVCFFVYSFTLTSFIPEISWSIGK